jgi:RecB family exonuclease
MAVMSDSPPIPQDSKEPSREEMMSALFVQLVLQQSNMAMMLLGRMPHPQSGKTVRDTESARMFIDQLEMIEAKTKGNLSREEELLLKQSLMSLRLAFVEAIETPPATGSEASSAAPVGATGPAAEGGAAPPAPETESDSKKKFSKKY